MILTRFRINTYEKHRGRGEGLALPGRVIQPKEKGPRPGREPLFKTD
jgi:hypothetical protein